MQILISPARIGASIHHFSKTGIAGGCALRSNESKTKKKQVLSWRLLNRIRKIIDFIQLSFLEL